MEYNIGNKLVSSSGLKMQQLAKFIEYNFWDARSQLWNIWIIKHDGSLHKLL